MGCDSEAIPDKKGGGAFIVNPPCILLHISRGPSQQNSGARQQLYG